MKYILKINALGQFLEVALSEKHFNTIKKSRDTLTDGLEMEEIYEILISNYFDFEMEILEQSAQLMIRNPFEYKDFFDARLGFNIKIINLLTACKLYVDQLYRHIRGIMDDKPNIKKEVKKLFSTEYDNHKEYRFMEAFRNHVQHQGTPVHWTQFNRFSNDLKEQRKLLYSMEIASQKKYLQKNRDFKPTVLDETPDSVDLKIWFFSQLVGERLVDFQCKIA